MARSGRPSPLKSAVTAEPRDAVMVVGNTAKFPWPSPLRMKTPLAVISAMSGFPSPSKSAAVRKLKDEGERLRGRKCPAAGTQEDVRRRGGGIEGDEIATSVAVEIAGRHFDRLARGVDGARRPEAAAGVEQDGDVSGVGREDHDVRPSI